MCLFTHFAAGALAGGLTGSVGLGALAGLASHAVLDMLPHYDHPDWRLELGGGLAALAVLLGMPFASWAAVVGGIAGMLPDLENLFQKLGKLSREQFVYPTHTGLLKHGRPLGPGNLAVQAVIFIACMALLGLAKPGAARAQAAPAGVQHAPAAVMGEPVVRVVAQAADFTVIRVDFPVVSAPADWQALTWEAIDFARPPAIDDLDDGIGGRYLPLPPRLELSVAVPTRALPRLTVTDVRWWREPDGALEPGALARVHTPAVYRGVPLAGCEVELAVGGGVPASVVLELRHPSTAPYAAQVAAAVGAVQTLAEPVPAGVLNVDLYVALRRGSLELAPDRAAAKAEPFDPFAATSRWVKLAVPATGLYRLTGQQLLGFGVPVGDVDPTKLRLYRGGGLALELDPEYPDSLQADRIGLNEVAIEVRDGGDGEWNLDDEIRFYGVGTSDWLDRFTPGALPLEHYDHPYASEATYWLTWAGDATPTPLPGPPRRAVAVNAPALGGQVVDTARLRVHVEQQYVDSPGVVVDNWTWDTSITSSRTDNFNLRTPVGGSSARFVADVRGIYDVASSFVFTAKAWLNSDTAQADSTVFGYSDQQDSLRVRVFGESSAIRGGSNTFTVANVSRSTGTRKPLALDSVDVLYWTALTLDPAFGQFDFAHWGEQVPAPATATDLRLALPAGIQAVVWDVTRPDSALVLTGTVGASQVTFGLVRQPGEDRHFVAADVGDLLAVASGSRVLPVSLLDDDAEVDYVVVAAAAFGSAAEDLAAHRSTRLAGVASPRARAVSAESVYDNFSGGQKDPLAIRNFLRRLYDQGGQRLRYACLLGKASRDYRNYRGRVPFVEIYDLLPTVLRHHFPNFAVPESRIVPFASDDAFGSFDSPPPLVLPGWSTDLDLPDVACGRLPAMTVQQAQELVDRVIAYDNEPAPGPWRNTVLLTSDDGYRPSTGQVPQSSEDLHMREAEYLAGSLLPPSLDVRKVYAVDYPFPPSSQVKPACRAAINAGLNAGTTVFYYVGHGAEDNLADEQIFRTSDIANLGNGGRRPLFVAFSCDVGVFDSPSRISMAEEFVVAGSGGAIGAICASQVSWSRENDAITNAFVQGLFPLRHVVLDRTVGEALRLGKAQMGNPLRRANSQRYNLMGDPGLRLAQPIGDLTLAESSVDTLRAGARQTVVLGGPGKALIGAGDPYRLLVQDSSVPKTYTTSIVGNPPVINTETWLEAGAPIFDGQGTLGGGDHAIPFKVPSQIRYGELGRVRLLVEAADGDHVAVESLPAMRGATGAVDDVRGPAIQLAFPEGRFRVRPGDELTATLIDTSGIAILGTSPGNSLLLELDDTGRMTNVTPSFVFDPDSYTRGSVVFPLPADLAAGSHRAALHASDALGNVGSDTLSFLIVPASVAGIEDVTLFPNPTPGPCRLLFELSDPMAVQWDIYTLAGNRLRTLREEFSEAGPRILEWDGRDHRGDEIANGTYLYVLRGTGASEDGREITKTGKLVIMR
ncbi:MAG: hypothetical protein IPK64_10140 [bacterium]|nr:hypothetical protein [bacterium]